MRLFHEKLDARSDEEKLADDLRYVWKRNDRLQIDLQDCHNRIDLRNRLSPGKKPDVENERVAQDNDLDRAAITRLDEEFNELRQAWDTKRALWDPYKMIPVI